MRRRIVAAIFAGALVVAVVAVPAAAAPGDDPCPGNGWDVHFNDEGPVPQLGDRNGDGWYCEKLVGPGGGNIQGGNQNNNRVGHTEVVHDHEGENHKETNPHWTP